ncbi:MAG: RNA polymerase sigma factor, partial [Gaiellaceae bacterium]
MVITTGELRLARPLRHDAGAEVERLYRKHSGEVLRYAQRVLRSRADAEDATQAVFIRALRALERGEHVRAPRNWLIKIAHNECRRLLSARKLHVELPDQLATEPEEAGRAGELKSALEVLPNSQRQALVLRELEGRTYDEIAATLRVSLSAVETLIFRARRAVREQLELAMTCEEFGALLDDPAARARIRAHARACAACAHLERQARGRKGALRRIASALGLPWWGAKVAAVAVTTATVAGGLAASAPPADPQPAHRQPAAPAVASMARGGAAVLPHAVRSAHRARRVQLAVAPGKVRNKSDAAVRAAAGGSAEVRRARHGSARPTAATPVVRRGGRAAGPIAGDPAAAPRVPAVAPAVAPAV